jgi:hypothetical protein
MESYRLSKSWYVYIYTSNGKYRINTWQDPSKIANIKIIKRSRISKKQERREKISKKIIKSSLVRETKIITIKIISLIEKERIIMG